jgi:23S rRNA (cytosine1962-C5)-methyltransferase
MNSPYYTVTRLHPETIKHALRGHPWITKDAISSKWPKNALLLHATLAPGTVYTYLHDPQHPFCVARLISKTKLLTINDLNNQLINLMLSSIKKRIDSKILSKRNHCYLIFGEADGLPGLHVHFLNGRVLIQTQMNFWDQHIKEVIGWLSDLFEKNSFAINSFWWQPRSQGQVYAKKFINDNFVTASDHFFIEELHYQLKVDLGSRYDHGIYTDMSGIREYLCNKSQMFEGKSVLNLFSYTGAFSLFSLKLGASYCCSLDSSILYQKILTENMQTNSIDKQSHHELVLDVQSGLTQLQKKKNHFDLIILDPPSSFTSNQKKVQAMQIYPTLLREVEKVASPKAYLLCFLNFHQKTRSQFEKMIVSTLPHWSIVEPLGLCADATRLPYFPEGDYLKGVLLKRK